MANFADAFFGGMNEGAQRRRQQEADEQARQMQQFEMEGLQAKRQDAMRQNLVGLAQGYKTYVQQNPQGGQQYYEGFLRPSLAQLGLGDAGPYNEQQTMALTDQVLAAYGGPGGGDQFTLGPGSKRFDASGRVIAEVPFAPANAQYVDVPDGRGGMIKMLLDPRTSTFTAPNFGGQPQMPAGGMFTGPDGMPTRIDPSLPQEVRQAIMADPNAWAGAPSGSSVQLPSQSGGGRLGYTPPKPEGGNESFSNPQPVTYPDGSVRLVQFGNRGSRREVEGVTPPPTDRDAKPPTEGERKAATLLQRLNFSLNQLEQAVQDSPDAASPSLTAEAARRLPFVGEAAANAITPANRQRVEAAQLDILDAALTLGTGAAYTKEQLEGYRRSYFPQIGDSDATIRDKAARLNNVIEAARIASGRAAPAVQSPNQGGWKIERIP